MILIVLLSVPFFSFKCERLPSERPLIADAALKSMEAYVREQEEQHKQDLEELMQEHAEELRKVKAKVTRKSWKSFQSSVLMTS